MDIIGVSSSSPMRGCDDRCAAVLYFRKKNRARRQRSIDDADGVTNPYGASTLDTGRDPTVPAHRLKTSWTDRSVHLSARRAGTGTDEHHVADRKAQLHEGEQVDPADGEVPTHRLRSNAAYPRERGDHREVLFLDERDLTLSAEATVGPRKITFEAPVLDREPALEHTHWRVVLGPDANPRERTYRGDIDEPFTQGPHDPSF